MPVVHGLEYSHRLDTGEQRVRNAETGQEVTVERAVQLRRKRYLTVAPEDLCFIGEVHCLIMDAIYSGAVKLPEED